MRSSSKSTSTAKRSEISTGRTRDPCRSTMISIPRSKYSLSWQASSPEIKSSLSFCATKFIPTDSPSAFMTCLDSSLTNPSASTRYLTSSSPTTAVFTQIIDSSRSMYSLTRSNTRGSKTHHHSSRGRPLVRRV